MGVCRASVERMSFNITTGEVWFNARARDGDVASQLVSGLTTSPVRFGVFPIRSSSVTFIRDPWSQPPPPTGNVTVPLCARGVGAWPIQFETSPIDFKLYLTGIAIQYDAIDYPNNGGYRGYTSSGSETPVLADHFADVRAGIGRTNF